MKTEKNSTNRSPIAEKIIAEAQAAKEKE